MKSHCVPWTIKLRRCNNNNIGKQWKPPPGLILAPCSNYCLDYCPDYCPKFCWNSCQDYCPCATIVFIYFSCLDSACPCATMIFICSSCLDPTCPCATIIFIYFSCLDSTCPCATIIFIYFFMPRLYMSMCHHNFHSFETLRAFRRARHKARWKVLFLR